MEATFTYGTYGELLSGSTGFTRFLYNGRCGVTTDENGLYYMRQRYYSPELKRFVNQDVLTGSLNNSQSLNRYSYVQGNPVSYTDPFGLSPLAGLFTGTGFIHSVLALFGCIPYVGTIFNLADAAIYAYIDHDYFMASLSLVGALTMGAGTVIKFAAKGSMLNWHYYGITLGIADWIQPIGGNGNMIKIYRTHDEPLELNVNTLKGAKLHRANFHRCLLNNIDATEADLSKVDFRSAEMADSVFNNVNFNNAQLIMVQANRSLFDGCVFRGSLLLHSDFGNSSFKYADFTEAVIDDVNFSHCDLRGAVLNCEGLETCCFDNAIYDDSTVWRKDFDTVSQLN